MENRLSLIEEVTRLASMCRRLQAEAKRNPPEDVTVDGVLGMIAMQLEDMVERHKAAG